MKPRSFHLHDGKKGAALAVRVSPRANKNEIVDILSDGTVKIHLIAPPVDGKANEALLKFLSKILEVPINRLEIVAGASGRDKLISVIGLDADTVHKKIVDQIG